jgi:hypothetical protein
LAARTKLWVSLLIALVVAQIAMSVLMPRGAALTIASDLIQGSLLLVATAAFLPNISARSLRHGAYPAVLDPDERGHALLADLPGHVELL